MGQGLLTTYAQLAVDVFGVPIERIRIVQGDTDRGTGFGSAGSRSLFVGGSAVHVAANETVDEARKLAAGELEAAPGDIEYRDGVFRIAGTDRQIGLFELAAKQPARRIVLDSTSSVDDATWPNGCHLCEVEIDPRHRRGRGRPLRVGQRRRPRRQPDDRRRPARGRRRAGHRAGAVRGDGLRPRERASRCPATFMDYALPPAAMFRHFDMRMDETIPCRNNLLGVKGVGELGTIGATPTVVSAVIDALVRAGVPRARVDALQMPLTGERVWRALNDRG